MKISKRQLRRIIRESLDFVNRESGEVIEFGEDTRSGIPDAAVPDLAKRLGIDLGQEELSHEDWTKLDDEVGGKQGRRASKKMHAQFMADEERLNVDNLLDRLQAWAKMASDDYMADNQEFPDTHLQDVAWDLASAAKYEFAQDEWDELVWHFDDDENQVIEYAAESMG